MSDTYVFIADPSHAWLRVPHTDLLTAGVAEYISHYSYIDPDFVYLEEDCDALLFITAMKVEPGQITQGSSHESVQSEGFES